MKNKISMLIVILGFACVPAHAAEILSNAWAYFFGIKWPKDKNKLNRDQPNRISLCTNWSLVEGKNLDEAVTVTTLFYDRKSLLAALNTL